MTGSPRTASRGERVGLWIALVLDVMGLSAMYAYIAMIIAAALASQELRFSMLSLGLFMAAVAAGLVGWALGIIILLVRLRRRERLFACLFGWGVPFLAAATLLESYRALRNAEGRRGIDETTSG